MLRHLTVSLLATLLVTPAVSAQGLVEYCPAAAVSQDHVDPFELIWDVSGGTTSVMPGDAVEVVFGADLAEDSTCRLDAAVRTFDSLGNLLFDDAAHIESAGELLAVERDFDTSSLPVEQRSPVFIDIQGSATGCTVAELRSFSVTTNTLIPRDAVTDTRVGDPDAFIVRKRDARPPVFRRAVTGRSGKVLRAVGPAQNLACPGGGRPQPLYVSSSDPVSPFDLIWDIDGGTTTHSAAGDSLVVFVTPYVLKDSCQRPRGISFLPKVQVEVVIDDKAGNRKTLTAELDATNPLAKFDFPADGNGERYFYSVQARSPACVAERGGAIGAVYIIEDPASQPWAVVEQQLPVTVLKVLPGGRRLD